MRTNEELSTVLNTSPVDRLLVCFVTTYDLVLFLNGKMYLAYCSISICLFVLLINSVVYFYVVCSMFFYLFVRCLPHFVNKEIFFPFSVRYGGRYVTG